MARVHLIAYSDYLCPWCFNATVRLRRLEEESAGDVEIAWRSYLLRPDPSSRRSLEEFRRYTRSWLRPAAEPDGGTFRVWEGDAGPPSHSVPPHLVAKAAGSLGAAEFHRVHDRLLHAYFAENRDVTKGETLQALWAEAGLPEAELARAGDESLLREVVEQHNEAVTIGVSGVPAVMMVGKDVPMMGAMSYDTYRKWVARRLEGEI